MLGDTRQTILQQTLGISLLALLAALLLLSVLGYWMTRRLHRLAQACRSIVEQQTLAQLDDSGRDEIALMARALNGRMLDPPPYRRTGRRCTRISRPVRSRRAGIARIELDGGIGFCNAKWKPRWPAPQPAAATRWQNVIRGWSMPDSSCATERRTTRSIPRSTWNRRQVSALLPPVGFAVSQPRRTTALLHFHDPRRYSRNRCGIGQQASSARCIAPLPKRRRKVSACSTPPAPYATSTASWRTCSATATATRILGRPLAARCWGAPAGFAATARAGRADPDHRGAELWLMCDQPANRRTQPAATTAICA